MKLTADQYCNTYSYISEEPAIFKPLQCTNGNSRGRGESKLDSVLLSNELNDLTPVAGSLGRIY